MGVEDDGSFLAPDWDPLLLVSQGVDFSGSAAALSSYNISLAASQGMSSTRMPRPSYLGCEGFSGAVGSFPLSTSSQVLNAQPPDFPSPSTDEHAIEKNFNAKKRKGSPLEKTQNNEAEQQREVSSEKDEKKQKPDLNPGINSQKPPAKNSKDTSQNADDSAKEDYIHVRAKRGQATNSHSLAERIRREKISERMKLLQDLVPGCNKITGKAVMLDEIINYVQSLQRQVEFLSMKLAAVNPELNFEIEHILSKDVLHSREGSSALLGFTPGMSNPNLQFHGSSLQGVIQPEMLMCSTTMSADMLRAPTHQISSMPHISSIWGHELQNVHPMKFVPNPPLDTKELTGSMNPEL